MRIKTFPTPSIPNNFDLLNWRVVVIDVLRASSSISQALANGAKAVIPVMTPEAAFARKRNASENLLLAGERNGLIIPGFDFGNSPGDFTANSVSDRKVVFTTTNGTTAILSVASAKDCVVGCFLNLWAVVDYLVASGDDVLLVASGREGQPAFDDQVCAGFFVDAILQKLAGVVALTDEASNLCEVSRTYNGHILDALKISSSGKALLDLGLGADLTYCARVGVLNVVPKLMNGELVI